MNIKPLPTEYVARVTRLTWAEVVWGVDNHWLEPGAPIEFAIRRVLDGSEVAAEVELAGLASTQTNDAVDLARRLAARESSPAATDPRDPWLCVSLRWLYDNRGRFSDPLGVVEEVYAEFDYPDEVASFVRYMPAENGYDPRRHSEAENEARLYDEWNRFVGDCATGRVR